MIVFSLIALLLLAGALVLVVFPLVRKRVGQVAISHDETNLAIYRDQLRELDEDLAAGEIQADQHARAKAEIERRVLEEVGGASPSAQARAHRGLALALGLSVPLIAVPLYLLLGSPAAINPEAVRSAGKGGTHEVTPEMIAAMVDQLAQRLRANPEDPEGWAMLAKSYAVMGRHQDAVQAYAEASKRNPGDAQMLADYADTLAVANGRRLAGEPERLINRALEVDPNNLKALALAGTVAFEAHDYGRAAKFWRRILDNVPQDSELGQRIAASVAEAESKATGKTVTAATNGPSMAAPTAKPAGAAAGAAITGSVAVSDSIRAGLKPEDVVFVFARAPSGSRMPLAIQRVRVADLPYEFKLDDAASMSPNVKLSEAAAVVVGARVSKTGGAMPVPGDWESDLVPAKPGVSGLRLQITRQVN